MYRCKVSKEFYSSMEKLSFMILSLQLDIGSGNSAEKMSLTAKNTLCVFSIETFFVI